MKLAIFFFTALILASNAQAVVLEGVGHATIHGDDVDGARQEARKAALRDVSLQYEARISSRDTVENGVVTESRLQVASSSRARSVKVVDEYRRGNLLRVTVRADMSESGSCSAGEASGLRKRVAVTGFPMVYPDQARIGRIDDAGEILPQLLQAELRSTGNLQVFGATTQRLFSDLLNAPTQQKFNNRLTNVIQVARELGVQFVVAGVIRDVGVSDPDAWGSSIIDRMQRGIGAVNQNRRFVADLMIYDGFSGSPIYQERFATEARWDAGPGSADGFGSAGFQETGYGRAVGGLMRDMTTAINNALACQPFITRVTRVDGSKVTLDSGATAGLRPGDELKLYRSASFFDSPGATPELQDSRTTMTLNNVHPDFSNGNIPVSGGQINIQRDDVAIVW
ncbi:flagellar assembly protein T N-terminal domain-containing protein [Marinobacter sp. TBZ242]|uniref:Flagellar assembly protein T N-terminal domain-containing protein n=1 Tax=Marinobacter azerbaijanicus TaxID=3050455 RepID=A0ABT7IBJ3_9GAMM|nr:flagellar assembly protein T N-terminal domain-containing protein [Marinobacter sp. TBZ242]MDL0431527.1 flagellar assembly protein T N-terminal domain-containing protein [Marinobacter sp. TBZ242]